MPMPSKLDKLISEGRLIRVVDDMIDLLDITP
jgi:hypothetical protein